jgi:hypothetical protein
MLFAPLALWGLVVVTGTPAAPPEPAVSFSFNGQAEGDRRTPARMQVRAGERLVVRTWVSAQSPAWIPEPAESFASFQVRDASGRPLLGRNAPAGRLAPPRSIPPSSARNFLVVVLPRCHQLVAGTYALEMRYAIPVAGGTRPLEQVASTTLEIQPAPPMERRHLKAEVPEVGLSEDLRQATGQIIVHNDGCDAVEFSTLPPGRLEVTVRDQPGRVVCQPDATNQAGPPSDVGTLAGGEARGLGVGWARCDPEAVRRAGPVTSLRARVRYDSQGLPGYRLVVDTEAPVAIHYEPRPGTAPRP